jgi:hypothetical protein
MIAYKRFLNQDNILRNGIFVKMSDFIETRTDRSCIAHYKNLIRKYGDVETAI